MLRTISITVRKPDKMLNLNDGDGRYTKAGKVSEWRNAGFWWAKQHAIRTRPAPGTQVEVWTEIGTNRPNHRRDPINWSPTVKAYCDGFTDAAVWPDDSSKYVRTFEPTFTADIPADSLRITLTWEEGEQ